MAKKINDEAAESKTEERADLVVAEVQKNPVALFTDPKSYSEFYARMRETVAEHKPDVSTDKGRRAIASLAFRVTRSKTTLDKAGLALTAQWRDQIKAVNESRFKMVEELDALADEVRQPLTKWEQSEAERVAKIDEAIRTFNDAAVITEEDTAATVEARGREIVATDLAADLFQERLDEVQDVKDRTIAALLRARDRLRQEEADRAELERLRLQAAEREEAERVEREKREAAELEKRERERAEEERRRAAEAEATRIKEAEERAAAAAREEAENARRAEEERRQREHDGALAAERAAREQAERESREAAERERLRRESEEAAAAETAAREKDKAHRRKLATEAKEDLIEICSLDEETARKVVLALASGSVRNLQFVY